MRAAARLGNPLFAAAQRRPSATAQRKFWALACIALSFAAVANRRRYPALAGSAMASSSSEAERAKAMLLGAMTADASSTGVHWIYRQSDVLALVTGKPKGDPPGDFGALMAAQTAEWASPATRPPPVNLSELSPEFFEPSQNPFYSYPTGELSPYGAEALTLVRSLVKEGDLVPDSFAQDSFDFLKAYPDAGGRLNGLSKTFIANFEARGAGEKPLAPSECGAAGNAQAHSLVRVPAIVARFGGGNTEGNTEMLLEKLSAAVRVHQTDPLPVALGCALALILQRAVSKGEPTMATLEWAVGPGAPAEMPEEAKPQIRDALAEAQAPGYDPRELGCRLGLGCSLPGSFTVALAIAAAHGSYLDASRANLMAGGDSASRASVIGALKAASPAAGGVPAGWWGKVKLREELEAAAGKMVAASKWQK